jgi:invasion protein IalB
MNIGIFVRPSLVAVGLLFAGQAALAQDAAPAAVAPTATPEAAQKLHYSNKWRIECKEGANNDGVARFEVTPKGEAMIPVTVTVKEGRSENGVAADVKNAFRAALDPKRYHVEIDDGEDVLVKRKSGPDLSIKLVESTLRGTHFDVERE